jgi:hypothetical protein
VNDTTCLSLSDRFSSLVEGLMNDVQASVIWDFLPIPLIKLLWRRLRRMKHRFASIMARFEAGTLPPPAARADPPHRTARRIGRVRRSCRDATAGSR